MKKITSLLVSIVLIVNASFGYTLTLKKGDFTLSRTGIESGTNMNFGSNVPMAWNVISGGVTPTIAGTERKQATFEMPEGDVSIEIFDAYTITTDISAYSNVSISPAGKSYVKPGDSITYTIYDSDKKRHILNVEINGSVLAYYRKNGTQTLTFTPTGDTVLTVNMSPHYLGSTSYSYVYCSVCDRNAKHYRCHECRVQFCNDCHSEGN